MRPFLLAAAAKAAAVVVLAAAAAMSTPLTLHAQQIRPGQGVSIETSVAAGGELRAVALELLDDSRSLTLRGPVEALDAPTGSLRIFGTWVRMLDDVADSAGDIEVGESVEIKVRREEDGTLVARAIELGGKSSPKIKGTVARVTVRQGVTVLDLGGIDVRVDADTDRVRLDNGMLEELFGILRAEETVGDEGGFHRLGSRVLVSGSLRPVARIEDKSLDRTELARRGVGEPSARFEVLGMLPGVDLFVQGQVGSSLEFYRSDGEVPTGLAAANWELRQLYLSARSILGLPVGVTVGKQRVRDSREFLFDEYLDGARLYVYPLAPLVLEASVFVPVAPRSAKYETWRDLLLQARWFPGEDWRATAYALGRSDRDEGRQRNVRYYGTSMDGKHRFLRLWANGVLLRGTDKGKKQEAWAGDAGLSVRARGVPLQPSLSVSAARGSGDADRGDGVSREFRQPGYEDNSSRVWGLASYRHFGEVLNPELSNIEVATASFGLRTRNRFSVDLVGHRYSLMELADELEDVALSAAGADLAAGVRALGYGIDAVVVARDVLLGVHLTYKTGVFLPGAAFPSDTPRAWLHKLELRADF